MPLTYPVIYSWNEIWTRDLQTRPLNPSMWPASERSESIECSKSRSGHLFGWRVLQNPLDSALDFIEERWAINVIVSGGGEPNKRYGFCMIADMPLCFNLVCTHLAEENALIKQLLSMGRNCAVTPSMALVYIHKCQSLSFPYHCHRLSVQLMHLCGFSLSPSPTHLIS